MKKITIRKTLALCALLLAGYTASAQAPEIEWQKTYGGPNADYGIGMINTPDGGYIIVGETTAAGGDVTNVDGSSDIWITKIAPNGSLQWENTYGGLGSEKASNIVATNDGGYVVAGNSTSSTGDLTTNHGLNDCWIFKIDAQGIIQWQKSHGGSGNDYAYSIKNTSDGGFIVSGDTYSFNGDVTGNHGNNDFWVLKLNPSGDLQWQKTLGGYSSDMPFDIIQANDGGYTVVGKTFSMDGDITNSNGGNAAWIVKLDSGGILQWQKTFGGSADDHFTSVQQNQNGYLLTGVSRSSNGDLTSNAGGSDIWIVQIDNNANIVWQKTYGGSAHDTPSIIEPLENGGHIILGYTYSNDGDVTGNHGLADIWLIKTDASGAIQWQQTYGGSGLEFTQLMLPTPNGGHTIVGTTNSNDGDVTENNGDFDFWIVKLGSDGTTATQEVAKNIFSLYPNPNNGTFTIAGDIVLDNATLNVYSTLGQLAYSGKVTHATVSISNLAAGVYQVQLTTGKTTYSQKLVIE